MYEDHWYSSSAVEDPSPAQKQRPPSSTPQTARREATPSKAVAPAATADQSTRAPEPKTNEPPKAQIPVRCRSLGDLKAVEPVEGGTALAGFDVEEVRGITNERQFANWYEQFEDELQSANDSQYRELSDTLSSYLYSCDVMLSETKETVRWLSDLSDGFDAVREQTSAFQESCDDLLTEQKRLESLSENISASLEHFNALEGITRKLHAPGSDIVTRDDFRLMLSKLDTCLAYVNAHPNFKDAEFYQSRYRQCMTRALTLIKVYVSNELRELSADVTKRLGAKNINETTQSALLYAKFRSGAPLLRDLTDEIDKRCGHEEYLSLMNECYGQYAGIRQKLLHPILSKKMNDISAATDLSTFARSAISYVKSVCLDEFDLFYLYFSSGENQVYDFLETLCDPLYDHLRPRIIHETQLVKLCELCSLFQTRYMRDPDDPETDSFENSKSQLDFGQLIQDPLQDAQTRVIFRSQTVIRNEIEYFTPKDDDLDYPRKNRVITKQNADSSNSEGDLKGFDTDAVFQGWYPTLRKSIWLLSKIYRLVNSAVFDDIAHQVVHICIDSLVKASDLIKSKKTMVDSQLFLVKHLLILKEQIVAFDIEYVRPEVDIDFSSVTGTFWEIREKGSLFNPNGLLKLMQKGLPKVIENMLDAKVELDGRLRTVLNEFTKAWASKITRPIVESSGRGPDAAKAVVTLKSTAEKEVPLLRECLSSYFDDRRTKESLVGAVQEMVIQSYESFYERAGDTVFVEEDISDIDKFVQWTNGIFGGTDGGGGLSDGSRSQSPMDSRLSE